MSETALTIFRCRACGEALFPARYRCPCGEAEFTEEDASTGALEEATVVRHRVGAARETGDVHLASVRTAAGVVVIARLDEALAAGSAVTLSIDDQQRIRARRG
ncbi:Zn-ribbon domain-containing OB-fold protein [Paraburkholderia acidisoli]|uniref:ChsH2 rubredoxin-like zinc ribbon domain-containing protein n=1 Tax=Paraburkholderia acidisoli TaxID=2571748 RepID=A0A7Z2GFU3_9BURK|nr:zinc ribbon domain-containing protein [Paraburkholderia acidisoli]QGZ61016.1 hypothetical protein FAZ98_04270 [Paraburkholderia acidisoli]